MAYQGYDGMVGAKRSRGPGLDQSSLVTTESPGDAELPLVYYSGNLSSSVSSDADTGGKEANFSEVRANPVIKDMSKYQFSVVRAQLNTKSLPLFVPLVQTGQANINLLDYEVGISLKWRGSLSGPSTYLGGMNVTTVPNYYTGAVLPATAGIPFFSSTPLATPVSGYLPIGPAGSSWVTYNQANTTSGSTLTAYVSGTTAFPLTGQPLLIVPSVSTTMTVKDSLGNVLLAAAAITTAGVTVTIPQGASAAGYVITVTGTTAAGTFTHTGTVAVIANTANTLTYYNPINLSTGSSYASVLSAAISGATGASNLSATLALTNGFAYVTLANSGVAGTDYTLSFQNVPLLAAFLGFPATPLVVPRGGSATAPYPLHCGLPMAPSFVANRSLLWTPQAQDPATTLPLPPLLVQDLGGQGVPNRYYYCYDYNWFLNTSVNPALSACVLDTSTVVVTSIAQMSLSAQLSLAVSAAFSPTAFSSGSAYAIGAGVYYNGGAYVCIKAVGASVANTPYSGNSTSDPLQTGYSNYIWLSVGPSYYSSWNSSTAYASGQWASSGGQWYMALAGSTGVVPTPGTSWSTPCGSSVALATTNLGVTSLAPRITFDPTTNLFSLLQDTYSCGGAARGSFGYVNGLSLPTLTFAPTRNPNGTFEETMTVVSDTNFYGLFANIQQAYVGPDTINGWSYVWDNTPSVDQNTVYVSAGSSSALMYQFTQDFISTDTDWCPIDSIVMTTAFIPVVNELQSALSQGVDTPTGNLASGSTSAFSNAITDIAVPLSFAQGYRGNITYSPTGEYRMISLPPRPQHLDQINIQFWWKNRISGEFIKIYLQNNENISFKLLFRPKYYGH